MPKYHVSYTFKGSQKTMRARWTQLQAAITAAEAQQRKAGVSDVLVSDGSTTVWPTPHMLACRKSVNFRDIPCGTLVCRSEHWLGQGNVQQIGMLTGKAFIKSASDPCAVDGVVCHPSVHWEGAIASATTHPLNVALYRSV